MVGILAYGSLIDDPGSEITPLIIARRQTRTPFCVEYARSSKKRGGAPTLVPVSKGGAQVKATILVLRGRVSEESARNMLWRRETGRREGRYNPPRRPSYNSVLIDVFRNLEDVDVVLSTRIAANIAPLNAHKLATLAIKSVKNPSVAKTENGIAYLSRAKNAGIVTPLTPQYEEAILRLTHTQSLQAAINALLC